MRSVINISLPSQLESVVEKEVKTGRFASKSEFFRSLLRMWIEGRLAGELESSREEFVSGKGKFLHSLKDLR